MLDLLHHFCSTIFQDRSFPWETLKDDRRGDPLTLDFKFLTVGDLVLAMEGEFTTRLSSKGCETVNAGLQVLQLDHPHRR